MKYEVNVDNRTEIMVVMDKRTLDRLYDNAAMHKEEADMGILYTMSKLGLLDDELRPTWR